MAHMKTCDGVIYLNGALRKKHKKGTKISITRLKHFRDPITGEEVSVGPNEMYLQEQRDYTRHPLTVNEQKQRAKWREACIAAAEILKDKSNPRYMELYLLWRAQLSSPKPCKQFPNFVRSVIIHEL